MASIPLLRVDNRLIHGQVTAFWIRSLSCNQAIIIDDTIPEDKFLRKILIMAMPPSTKLSIFNTEEAVREWHKNQFGDGKVMVIFKDIAGACKAYAAGFNYTALQIGGSSHTTGQKQVLGPIYMNENEAKMLNELEEQGVDITFQVLSEQQPTQWKTIRKKSFPNIN